MYATINFKYKKELIAAIKRGEKIGIYSPSGFFPAPDNGNVCVEGPHYPKPHTWYAQCVIKDGYIVDVK